MFTRRKVWRVPAGQEPTALDKKVMAMEAKGAMVPKRSLIRTPEEIEGIKKSGVINTAILDLVGEKIHAGMSTLEINDLVHNYTIEHGAIPATLGYEGYPKSVCVSINEVVCHGIPSAKEILKEGDIVNVDCTTILNGYYADASRMYVIGKTSTRKQKLVDVAKECLYVGMEAAKPFGLSKSWWMWPRNASMWVWRLPSHSASLATSAMLSNSMPTKTASAWCVTSVVMAWVSSSTTTRKCCIMEKKALACSLSLAWYSPLSR